MRQLPDTFTKPHILSGMPPDTPILAALSGGADSTSLLHLLVEYSHTAGCKIYAAHVNHNIRNEEYGNEAKRDELFCRQLCQSLGVELFVLSADVPAIARESKKSLELAARDLRYSFFSQIMKEHNIPLLATAHNADDNLETQIYNLCRGCGVEGIRGILPCRSFSDIENGKLIRPLINASKKEIYELCALYSWDYVTDSTNFESDCTRNKIRHQIIEPLRVIFNEPTRNASRLSQSATEDCEFILNEALKLISLHSKDGSFPLDIFSSLHIAQKKRILICLCPVSLQKVHIDALLSICDSAAPLSMVSLPEEEIGYISRDGKLLSFGKSIPQAYKSVFELKPENDLLKIPDSDILVLITEDSDKELPSQYGNATLYTSAKLYGISKNELLIRSRVEGDKITDGGMNKKVKKLICDKKIPAVLRDCLPVFTDTSGEILYVPGCALSDRVKLRNSKKQNHVAIGIYI